MILSLGSSKLSYVPLEGWAKLPKGWSFLEVCGVAVDSRDNVYAFTEGEHPVIVFDRQGNFLRSWGEGAFKRPHGIHVSPDDFVYCVDNGNHTIKKFTPEGKHLLTLGLDNQPSVKWGGEPFNQPTHTAVSPKTGMIFVTDGYGNSRVHKYTPEGKYVFSWGEPGLGPGQFVAAHNIAVDKEENVYIADRENHRVQVFNSKGELQAIWQYVHRPAGICLDDNGYLYVAESAAFAPFDDCPGLGHQVSIFDLEGKLLGRLGEPETGEAPGQFTAPHGIAVDSQGDLYIAELSYSNKGRHMTPPRELRSFQKLARKL